MLIANKYFDKVDKISSKFLRISDLKRNQLIEQVKDQPSISMGFSWLDRSEFEERQESYVSIEDASVASLEKNDSIL